MSDKKESVLIVWDWREAPCMKKLEEIGLFVYEDPLSEGSDQLGYIVSKKKLTNEELKKYHLLDED